MRTGSDSAEGTGCVQDLASMCCNRLMDPGCTQPVDVPADSEIASISRPMIFLSVELRLLLKRPVCNMWEDTH